MRKILLALALLLAPTLAFSQAVQQSGTVTPKHAASWTTNGVIQDAGTASNPNVTTFGVVNNGGPGICVDTGLTTASGYQQFCLSASLNGAAQLSLQNYGTATAQNICFNVNGTQTCVPTGGGGTVPTLTLPLVANQPVCGNNSTGDLKGCSVGVTNGIPLWTSSVVQGVITPAASSVLISSSGSVPSWSQTLPSAVQGNITSVGTITSGVWSGTPITVVGGGTGAATLAAHGVLFGEGTSAVTSLATATIGSCLLSQGISTDPVWASCASGSGSAGGSNTQVQFNNSSSLAGSANFTWVSPALTIGANGSATGQLVLAFGGGGGASVTLQNLATTVAYNFNLPSTSGSSGQPLVSGGGGSASMAFQTLTVAGGGTNCSSASGTCLDNISGFASTGFINRTGAGTYAFAPQITLANGGTSANLTASNGGIFYSTASAGAILSGTATANQILMSGASSAPAWSTATYPATTTINQLLYSSSANTVVGLTTANNAILVTGGTGIPSIGTTIPSAVQLNITSVGTVTAGTWQATPVALLYGGTNAALTASNGGIFYSTASAGAILAGTATASLPMLSASSTAPTWATIQYPVSATSGGIPYFSSTTAMASSGLLTQHAIVLGGGAGATPTVVASLGTTTTVLHGAAAGNPTFGAVSLTADVSGILPSANGGTGVNNSKNLTVSNSMTLAAGADAQTWTFPSVSDTIGGLGTAQTWTAQNTHNVASTITSATAATLRDVYVQAATTTITGNTGSPITSLNKVYIGQPTLTDASAVTVTDAASLYIDNAPAAAGSVTITNAWAIQVAAGNVKFAGTGNSLGTITSGTWNGSVIIATYGGTNNAFFQVSGPASSIKTYTFPNSSQTMAALDLADQTLSGGANVTSSNQGTKSSGTFTVDCGVSPLQYITNGGAFTLAAPSNDGSCIVRSVNNGSAGTITFSGFTVGSNTGDSLNTTNTNAFAIQIWRINSVSRYLILAYQ